MRLSFANTVTIILILLVALSCGGVGLTLRLQVSSFRDNSLNELKSRATTAAQLIDPNLFYPAQSLQADEFPDYVKGLSVALAPILDGASINFFRVENDHVAAGGDYALDHISLWKTAVAGKAATGTTLISGEKQFMAVSPVRDGLDGTVVGVIQLARPYQLLSSETLRALWPVFILGGIILIMAFVSAYLFHSGLLRSLRTLAEATQIFGLGNLDHRVRVEGKGEIGRLCSGFNQMARQLKNSRESLMARTQDLEESNAKLEVQIRERRKAEELLRESQESYQTMAETASDGLVTVDKELRIQFVNPAMETILGYSEEEMLTSILTDLLDEDHLDCLPPNAPFNQPIRVVGIHKDSRSIPIEVSWGVSKSEGEEYYIGIIRDIQDRIRYEEELEQAKELAEKATAAKSEFLANMSHEIRTPMNAVIGMAAMLLDTELSKQQREYSLTIHNSGESLLTLINNILDFSKMESGKMELDQIEFNLVELIEETLDMLGTKARENELLLAYECRPGTPVHLLADSNRLRQVFINVINNALKFTHDGHVLLSAKAEELENDEYEIHFTVEDTGIGIPDEKLPTLFQSFHQVDASTTRKYGGTGLGLAICKSFCELMGGDIWVESEVGKGSKFNFTIKAKQLPKSPVCFLHSFHPELATMRIAVHCASPILQRIVTDYTSWWGMNAMVYEDRDEFMDVIQTENSHFIFLDARANDREIVKEVQRIGLEKGFHSIILTDLGAPFEDGANVSITHKPLKAVELFQIISGEVSDVTETSTFKLQSTSTFRLADVMPMDILVAEDNFVNQKVAREFLNRLGYGIDLANDGNEAVEAVRKQHYDVVFMDVHMPEMDGLEASQKIIMEIADAERPYIIAMTASAMPGDREMCLSAGMKDYISKPVKIQAIRKALEGAWKVVGTEHGDGKPKKQMRKTTKGRLAEPTPAPVKAAASPPVVYDSGRIDYATLNFFRNGDDPHGNEVVRDLIELYFNTFEDNFAKLMASMDAEMLDRASKLAHTIKGSSGNIGVTSIATLCKEIEGKLKASDLVGAQSLLRDLKQEADEAKSELDAFVALL